MVPPPDWEDLVSSVSTLSVALLRSNENLRDAHELCAALNAELIEQQQAHDELISEQNRPRVSAKNKADVPYDDVETGDTSPVKQDRCLEDSVWVAGGICLITARTPRMGCLHAF